MNHQFKPFDKVLVRDKNNELWYADFYSHYDHEYNWHCCVRTHWNQCIPYNENTKHLVGTSEPYKEPEPKVWHVKNLDTGVCHEFTQSQFEHFIKDVQGSKSCCAYAIHRIQ